MTVNGEPIALSGFRGKVVVLLFLPTLPSPDCSTCTPRVASPSVVRLEGVWQAIEPLGENVRMIVVSESALTPEQLPLTEDRISYISDPDIVRLYRRSYGAFVIDQEGVIRAMDEAWARLVDGRPRGELDRLHAVEILSLVERLLSQGDGD